MTQPVAFFYQIRFSFFFGMRRRKSTKTPNCKEIVASVQPLQDHKMRAKVFLKTSSTPKSSRRNSFFLRIAAHPRKMKKIGGNHVSWGLVVAGCGGMGLDLGVRQLEAKAHSPPRAIKFGMMRSHTA